MDPAMFVSLRPQGFAKPAINGLFKDKSYMTVNAIFVNNRVRLRVGFQESFQSVMQRVSNFLF